MDQHQPPANLPAGYRPVWTAVAEADRRLRSRRQLAAELGMSTHTLQRLLVDGDVPDFQQPQSTRLQRSWTAILSRLARYFGQDPRAWVGGVGLSADAVMAGEPAAPESPRPGTSAPPPALTVGLATVGASGGADDRGPRSFMGRLARLALGAHDPDIVLTTVASAESALFARLASRGADLHAALGIHDLPSRPALNGRAVPIPGLRVSLAAIVVQQPDAGAAPLAWRDAVASPATLFVAVRDGVAHHMLAGAWGIPPAGLHLVGHDDPDAIAARAIEFLDANAARSPVLVGDIATLRQVTDAIEQGASSLVVSEVRDFAGLAPRYPLAIAAGDALPGGATRLAEAMARVVYGSSLRETAQLYAELLAADDHRVRFAVPAGWRAVEPAWELTAFAEADREFRGVACRHLLHLLSDDVVATRTTDARHLAARWAEQRAALLVPAAWRRTLRREIAHLRQETPNDGVVATLLCLSCNADLLDADNRGRASTYCRHCADAQGRLRPRSEVRQVLARWMRHARPQLSHAESERRADAYMVAMPAWRAA